MYYNDPTNLDSKYKRNHIRINIFPKLENRDEFFKKLLDNYNFKVKEHNKTSTEYKKNKNKFMQYNSSSKTIKIDKFYITSLSFYSFKLIFQGIINEKFNVQVKKTKKYWKEFCS